MLVDAVKHTPAPIIYASGMQTMAERIRVLRESKGLSQTDLAKLCGVTKGAVSQWELASTANIKLEPFLALCESLGTTPHYLVFGPERAKQQPSTGSGNRR